MPAHVTTTKPAVSLSHCLCRTRKLATIYPSLYRPSLKLYSTHKQNGFRDQRRAADLNATRDAATSQSQASGQHYPLRLLLPNPIVKVAYLRETGGSLLLLMALASYSSLFPHPEFPLPIDTAERLVYTFLHRHLRVRRDQCWAG